MGFHRFCKAIIDHQPIPIYDDGEQTRDFTYISDVVEANIRAATADTAVGQIMNIAGGSRVNMLHVIQLLQEISGSSISLPFERKQHGDFLPTFSHTQPTKVSYTYPPL